MIVQVVCFLILLSTSPAFAQSEATNEEPPPPWELSRQAEGESRWAPLFRIRDAELQYRGTRWWNSYAQMRALFEAGVGSHADALGAWDSGFGRPDSVGALPPGTEARDAIEYLSAVADTARVLMINERHHAASDRLLTLELLRVLREKGFTHFAVEAFDPADTALNAREYPVEATGTYVQDPVFAEVVREAIRLGYTLVAYEATVEQEDDEDLTPQQRRDFGQARNLARATFKEDAEARVFVHAGYSHILETASERWYPMAVYFREITGIDPVTVDQTRLSERGTPAYEHPDYRAAIAAGLLGEGAVVLVDSAGKPYLPASFSVDIQVLTPRTTYANGRPDWMSLAGRRQVVEVATPECESQWCFVEARLAKEPPEAVPLDRSEVRDAGSVRLFLPPDEEVVIRILDSEGRLLRTSPP